LNRINLMLPVQSPSKKYSRSLLTQITSTSLSIPAHTEGRFAIVTDVGLGCDGRGYATDERVILRTAKSCGPDASMVGVKCRRSICEATVTTKPDHRGEYEGNR
jgi:hypothetical protein